MQDLLRRAVPRSKSTSEPSYNVYAALAVAAESRILAGGLRSILLEYRFVTSTDTIHEVCDFTLIIIFLSCCGSIDC